MERMLYIERREKILEMLKKSGNVKVSDLVDIFHVDATTIRRDLKALADGIGGCFKEYDHLYRR